MQTMYHVQPIPSTLLEKWQCYTVPEVVDYFGILQELYVFISGSPQRWGILNTQGNLAFSLKS